MDGQLKELLGERTAEDDIKPMKKVKVTSPSCSRYLTESTINLTEKKEKPIPATNKSNGSALHPDKQTAKDQKNENDSLNF